MRSRSFVGPFDFGLNVSNGFPIFTQQPDPATFAGTIQSQNLNFKQGRVQQFNLNVEQELPGSVVLTVGYAGSRSHHILVDGSNLNVSSPSACFATIPDPATPGGTLPNPVFDPNYHLGCGIPAAPFGPFTTIANINDGVTLATILFRSRPKPRTFGTDSTSSWVTPTRATSTTDSTMVLGSSTGVTYFPLPGTTRADWSLSQVQLNHNFTASVLYDLPFGKGKRFGSSWNGGLNAVLGNWQINVIEKITSGFPVFVIASNNSSGVNLTNNGNNFTRPDQICSPKADNATLSKWFNTQCFVDPQSGELGKCAPSARLTAPTL